MLTLNPPNNLIGSLKIGGDIVQTGAGRGSPDRGHVKWVARNERTERVSLLTMS